MSMESEGATSNIELGSVLACEGDLPLHETANFKAEPTSPKASADQERETRLEAIAAEIESVLGTAIMRVAALVAEAHELHRYQHGDGGFEGWFERRLKMSRRTAYNLLDVHKRFGDQSVQILHTLPRSVLYLIAPDNVAEAARTEVIERAQAGERLSHAQVKEIITGHKPNSPAPNTNRRQPKQAQASRDVANEPTLFDSPSLAPLTPPKRKIEATSPAEQKGDVAPPVASTDPAPSPDPIAAPVDKTKMPTAAGTITAKEEPKPVEFTPPPDPIILRVDADLDSADRAIDVLYSRWRMLALRAIEKAIHDKAAVRTVKAIHDKAAGLEMQSHLAKNTEAERQARVIRLWAERRLGEWLIDTKKNGLRYMGRPPKGVKIGKQDPDLITLGKLGISRKESQDLQKIARSSDARFEALLAGKPGRCRLPHHRRNRVRRFRPRRDAGSSPQTQADGEGSSANTAPSEIPPAA